MEHTFGVATSPAPHTIIFQMLMGSWTTKVLSDVIRLGVPDALLQHGPLTAAELTRNGACSSESACAPSCAAGLRGVGNLY
jgi:hypothetical protein